MSLVLSVFPGIDLIGRAFEEHDFCVVRGPDLLWGGDVHAFHSPAGRFDGLVGGPPCQRFSTLAPLVRHTNPDWDPPDLIPEFERVVAEAAPSWFIMENVAAAPVPAVPGYEVRDYLFRDVWVGGQTSRQRRFSFGSRDGRELRIEYVALHGEPQPAVVAGKASSTPVAIGGSGKPKVRRANGRSSGSYFREAVTAQGLPADFDLPGMTVAGKIKAVGNGVPMAMGRAIARAVKEAMTDA